MNKLTELSRSRELVHNLTLRELRGKYKRSTLGWTWSLLNPLATMAIYSVVFGTFLNLGGSEFIKGDPSGLKVFALWLMCGLLPWAFLANSMIGGMETLVSNGSLIKKVWFPREALVVGTVSSSAFTLCIELGVLAVALLIAGNMVLIWVPLVLLVMAIQYLFALGVAMVLSVLNVYFRDVRHLVGILLQLWFYLTPIVYPFQLVEDVGDKSILGIDMPVAGIYSLNPMKSFTDIYRSLLYDLRVPALHDVVYVVGISAAMLLFGWFVFSRLEGRLGEEL